MISVSHAVPRDDVLLGILRADAVDVSHYPARFDELLIDLLDRRTDPLTSDEEGRRSAARDILRNGRYKPTGRGKPASEYLLRAAAEAGGFPRINAPVDICNYLSLKHVVPISLWDLDLAQTADFVFRLGRPAEEFVFNEGGQTIDVEDLLVGCRVREDGIPTEDPIVNPVKDSLLTKTTPSTTRVGACIYAAAGAFSSEILDSMCREFADLLEQCGTDVQAAYAVLAPSESAEV